MTELSQFRSNFDCMLGGMLRGHWEEAWNAGWGCEVKDDDAGIDEDNIQANCKNGILEVHLPKSDAVTPKRVAVTAN